MQSCMQQRISLQPIQLAIQGKISTQIHVDKLNISVTHYTEWY